LIYILFSSNTSKTSNIYSYCTPLAYLSPTARAQYADEVPTPTRDSCFCATSPLNPCPVSVIRARANRSRPVSTRVKLHSNCRPRVPRAENRHSPAEIVTASARIVTLQKSVGQNTRNSREPATLPQRTRNSSAIQLFPEKTPKPLKLSRHSPIRDT